MEEKKTTRFAGNLTALRRKAGETQNDLAEVLGVSNKTVSKWETCESEPELSMLTEIAAHYGVSVDALLAHDAAALIEDPYTGLGWAQTALKCFAEDVRHTFDSVNAGFSHRSDLHEPVIPPLGVRGPGGWGGRTGINTSEVFREAVSAKECAIAVTLMQNADNYAWLERDGDKLAETLCLLGKPGMLKFVRWLHRHDAPDGFTLEYAARQSGADPEDIRHLLTLLCRRARTETAEFPDGKKDVYFFEGDGWLLSALCCLGETVLHPYDRETGPSINAGCYPVFDDGDHAAYLAAHPEVFDCENWSYEE